MLRSKRDGEARWGSDGELRREREARRESDGGERRRET